MDVTDHHDDYKRVKGSGQYDLVVQKQHINVRNVLVEAKTRVRVRMERNRATLRPMKRYTRPVKAIIAFV